MCCLADYGLISIADYWSTKYQWLPSEFYVDAKGHVDIRSYINNLHPNEMKGEVYPLIAAIFERFVPLFERVLFDLMNPKDRYMQLDCDWYPPMPDYLDEEGGETEEKKTTTTTEANQPVREYSSADDWYNRRVPLQPKAPTFSIPNRPQQRVDINLKGRHLQVIVKLSQMELTPEKPRYDGGVWHVEGCLNERIVASGIYYFHSENITESRLSFRTTVHEPMYEQGDHRGVELIYGLKDGCPLVQHLGSVITQPGRLLAFPNLFQHFVEPFELADPTRNGIRQILVFFLVDPFERIVSSAEVPPQQASFYTEEQQHLLATALMSREMAIYHRQQLMTHRKFKIDQGTKLLFEREFSLCEH